MTVYRFVDGLEEHFVIFPQYQDWTFREWKSDAQFMYCGTVNANLDLLVFCNLSHAQFRGTTVISCARSIPRCEMFYLNGELKVNCSEEDILISREEIVKAFTPWETVPKQSGEGTR